MSVSPFGGQEERPGNYQDVVVFEPGEGVVSVRRMVIGVRGEEQPHHALGANIGIGGGAGAGEGGGGMGGGTGISVPIPIPGATSISLPGMGMLGARTSSSYSYSHGPGNSYSQSGSPSGLSRMMREESVKERERRGERERTLVAKEGVVASWGVVRKVVPGAGGKEMREVREVVREERVEAVRAGRARERERDRGARSQTAEWVLRLLEAILTTYDDRLDGSRTWRYRRFRSRFKSFPGRSIARISSRSTPSEKIIMRLSVGCISISLSRSLLFAKKLKPPRTSPRPHTAKDSSNNFNPAPRPKIFVARVRHSTSHSLRRSARG